MTEQLLTVNDVAGLLNVSPRHVYRMTDAGEMPKPLKLGRLNRWERKTIDNWIANGCRPVRTMKR